MNTFYSIISVMIRPEIEEKISLGMLMISENGIYLNISKTKLSVCKDLLPELHYLGVKNEITSIRNYYTHIRKEAETNDLFSTDLYEVTKESYLRYLSNYKTNLVVFSKPIKLSLQVTKEIFDTLYEKYVDEELYAVEVDENEKSIEKFRREFIPKLQPYYNTNLAVGSDMIPGVLAPIKFDLVGRNEIPVFAKSIDLERRTYNVEHDVNALYPIKDLSTNAKTFIISKEPDKKLQFQHSVWNNLRTSPWFEYIDISEADRLEVYAKEHNVEPIQKEIE